ncbi:hypothetical protein HanIR_Chr16g0821881 [Helianthus annuus]|nr:hypothetical protein HanIR_Chr16g0821881 [Helianthus annuus]
MFHNFITKFLRQPHFLTKIVLRHKHFLTKIVLRHQQFLTKMVLHHEHSLAKIVLRRQHFGQSMVLRREYCSPKGPSAQVSSWPRVGLAVIICAYNLSFLCNCKSHKTLRLSLPLFTV